MSALRSPAEDGADFVDHSPRGMKVRAPGRTLLLLSDTAILDDQGGVLHPGDLHAQTRRIVDGMRRLLGSQGARLGDLVSLTRHLAGEGHHDSFHRLCRDLGLGADLAHTLLIEWNGRPGSVVEMEALAMLTAP